MAKISMVDKGGKGDVGVKVLKAMLILEGMSLYQTADGYVVRRKGWVDKKRIAKDPSFKRVRENAAEFGSAARAGKLVRRVFGPLVGSGKDGRVSSRLTKELVKVVQTDSVSGRGSRSVSGGDLRFIEGFDFNVNARLKKVMLADYGVGVDRQGGEVKIVFPAFVAVDVMQGPGNATHVRVVSGVAEVNFDSGVSNVVTDSSGLIALEGCETVGIGLSHSVGRACKERLLVVLGVEFYQVVNGRGYVLGNGACNAFAIVRVDEV